MIQNIYNFSIVQNVLRSRRIKRINYLLSKVKTFPNMKILDIGCGPDGRSLENYLSHDYEITGIDLYDESEVKVNHPNFTYYKLDASDMSVFKNKQFDLVISIGMMAHICDSKTLSKMASEINRISKQYVIVVPWKYAWIEPHFKLPFFQLLPEFIQISLTKIVNLNNLKEAVIADKTVIRANYQWFSNSEWESIFNGSKAFLCPTLETIALVKRA